MKIFNKIPDFDIMGKRKVALAVSILFILAGLFGFAIKGVQYGIDFKGGTLVQAQFTATPPLKKVRETFNKQLNASVSVITFGEATDNELMITLPQGALGLQGSALQESLGQILRENFPSFSEIRRLETVGPKAGAELKENAIQAAFYVMLGILFYIGIRFRIQFAVASIVALVHDVMITMGIFVLLDKEFTLTIVAAILTIIGYSLNDTIVVFDRVRENMARMPKSPLLRIINISVNESLSRTILTSVTTFFVVLVLFLFGGEIIHDFSFALMIGLVVGTYSSIFVASPVIIFFEKFKKG